ncbi:MAG: NifU family protein [Bacteroidales bacterium]|nr:NifU family protein [Bacteroidales bacterium]
MNKSAIEKKVLKAIDKVRPYLITDGGDVELLEITDDMVVKVKLLGACCGCPFSEQTLRLGIEESIRKEVPDVKSIESVAC